jgi:hypothetical protein
MIIWIFVKIKWDSMNDFVAIMFFYVFTYHNLQQILLNICFLMFDVNFCIFQLMNYHGFLSKLEIIYVELFLLIRQKFYDVLHMCF